MMKWMPWGRKRAGGNHQWLDAAARVRWQVVEEFDDGGTRVAVWYDEEFDGYPVFQGAVLREGAVVLSEADPEVWSVTDRLTFTDSDWKDVDVYGNFLACRSGATWTFLISQRPEPWIFDIPAARADILGLRFVSLTTRCWVNDGREAVILFDSGGSAPGVGEQMAHWFDPAPEQAHRAYRLTHDGVRFAVAQVPVE